MMNNLTHSIIALVLVISVIHGVNGQGKYFTGGYSGYSVASADILVPIELISFDVRTVGSEVLLDWSTASELNNDFFTIERSDDGTNFTSIGILNGAGNSKVSLDYQFLDSSPIAGLSYYRIKQTDFDGKYEYTPLRTAYLTWSSNSKLYPNPVDADIPLTILYESEVNQEIEVKTYNLIGQLQMKIKFKAYKGQNKLQLSIDQLAPSIYFVELESTSGQSLSAYKVIKR